MQARLCLYFWSRVKVVINFLLFKVPEGQWGLLFTFIWFSSCTRAPIGKRMCGKRFVDISLHTISSVASVLGIVYVPLGKRVFSFQCMSSVFCLFIFLHESLCLLSVLPWQPHVGQEYKNPVWNLRKDSTAQLVSVIPFPICIVEPCLLQGKQALVQTTPKALWLGL